MTRSCTAFSYMPTSDQGSSFLILRLMHQTRASTFGMDRRTYTCVEISIRYVDADLWPVQRRTSPRVLSEGHIHFITLQRLTPFIFLDPSMNSEVKSSCESEEHVSAYGTFEGSDLGGLRLKNPSLLDRIVKGVSMTFGLVIFTFTTLWPGLIEETGAVRALYTSPRFISSRPKSFHLK